MRRALHLVVIALLAIFIAPHGNALARATANHYEAAKDDSACDLGVQPSARSGAVVSKVGLPFPLGVRAEWSWQAPHARSKLVQNAPPGERLVDQRSSIRRFRLRGHAPPGSADGPSV